MQGANDVAISTKPVGSLPCPAKLQAASIGYGYGTGGIGREQWTREQDVACLDSNTCMEATATPIVSDGEQRATSFATYPLKDSLAGTGLAENLAGDGQYYLEQAMASTKLGF